jgi:hypothetical protein
VQGTPAAAEGLGRLAVVGVHEALELLGREGANRQAAAPIDGRAQLLYVLLGLVATGVGLGVLAHLLLPSAG